MDSQAIVNTMEVLETKPLSELVTEATIKVCYVSDKPNPNRTVITREVGKEIASTLPGAPVAGFFNKETGDFEEHNRTISFQNGELIFEDVTKPYGFVSPVDEPWYQDFMEDGEVKTYLMCKAYLWTRQYEEASLALNKGQSMELDEGSMSGYFEGDVFVFTSVTLDKLCILGDNFAPCFAGAKIIKTYCKQFNGLAEQLEKTIGRRYYVMNDQLVTKPDTITLDYALQLGWNLTDAVYTQLANRGAQNKYDVQGIYSEAGEIFAILQDRENLEYVRCTILITDQDTVELASEMTAVKQTWAPKTPVEPASVEPLNGGGETVAEQTVPMNVSATYTEGGTTPAAVTEPVATPALDNTLATPATDNSLVAPVTTPVAEPVVTTEPAIDFAAKIEEMTTQLADVTTKFSDLEQKMAVKDTEISNLTATIAAYKAAEDVVIGEKKTELVTSYKSLLSEEEMAGITEKIADYSLEELESKLAVTYTRKQRASAPAGGMQLNINSITPDDSLPDFIKQAKEYDKNRELKLV